VEGWDCRGDPVNNPLWKDYPITLLFAKRLDNKAQTPPLNHAQFLAVCRRSQVVSRAGEDIEEARVFAGEEPGSGKEIHRVSASVYVLQTAIN
jgi:hypothetical protein